MNNKNDDSFIKVSQFNFKIIIEDIGELSATEVSGINLMHEEIEYRGITPESPTIKMPYLQKPEAVDIKKIRFVYTEKFKGLFDEINVINRKSRMITISLIGNNNEIVMTWQLKKAIITKIGEINHDPIHKNSTITNLSFSYENKS